jgi:hypothetical protein
MSSSDFPYNARESKQKKKMVAFISFFFQMSIHISSLSVFLREGEPNRYPDPRFFFFFLIFIIPTFIHISDSLVFLASSFAMRCLFLE